MIALDTNILARYILNDSPAERAAAEQVISANRCSVGWSVLAELCWVLEAVARLPKKAVLEGLATIAGLPTVTVPDEARLDWVLERYAKGADFADMVHLSSAIAGATGFATFDRKLARQAGGSAPLPVQTLNSAPSGR